MSFAVDFIILAYYLFAYYYYYVIFGFHMFRILSIFSDVYVISTMSSAYTIIQFCSWSSFVCTFCFLIFSNTMLKKQRTNAILLFYSFLHIELFRLLSVYLYSSCNYSIDKLLFVLCALSFAVVLWPSTLSKDSTSIFCLSSSLLQKYYLFPSIFFNTICDSSMLLSSLFVTILVYNLNATDCTQMTS